MTTIHETRTLATLALLATLLAACGDSERASRSGEPEPTGDPARSYPGVAIENVTVIDGVGGARAAQTVVFSGDRIVAVLPASQPVTAERVIDGSGHYLVPGLWDFHVHLTYDDRWTESMPALFLSWGVTSVRDTGGLLHKIQPVARALRAEDAVAPRVFYAGPLLDGEFVVYDGNDRPEIGVSVPDPEAARRVVTELAEAGVDFIKIYELVSPPTFAALSAAAGALGLPIDSHVPLSMRARVAGAQVNAIEHLRNIELDCAAGAEGLHAERLGRLENAAGLSGFQLRASLHSLQRLAAIADFDEGECGAVMDALTDTTMVPTLRLNSFALAPSYRRDDWLAALARAPADARAEWRAAGAEEGQGETDTRFAEWSLRLTRMMFEAGVPVAAGTDTPINLAIPGYSLHEELEMLVRAGLSELDALAAATLEPARWFGLEGELGSIAVGMRADLLLLAADPLADIRHSKRIALVVSKGDIVFEAGG